MQVNLDYKSSQIIVNQVLCLERQIVIYSLHFFYITELYRKCKMFFFFVNLLLVTGQSNIDASTFNSLDLSIENTYI